MNFNIKNWVIAGFAGFMIALLAAFLTGNILSVLLGILISYLEWSRRERKE